MLQNVLWPIDKLQLSNYQIPEGYNNLEEFSVTDDGKYGVFLYNIYERTMNAWYCAFAIYGNTDFKTPLVHLHADQRPIFCKFHGKTFDYAPLSNCFIMVYSAYKPDSKRPTMPYLFVKPLEKKFALLPWDFTSIYYGFAEIENNTLKLYEKSPTQLDCYEERNKHTRKTGMKFIHIFTETSSHLLHKIVYSKGGRPLDSLLCCIHVFTRLRLRSCIPRSPFAPRS